MPFSLTDDGRSGVPGSSKAPGTLGAALGIAEAAPVSPEA